MFVDRVTEEKSNKVMEMSRTWRGNLQAEPFASIFTVWRVLVRSTDSDITRGVSPKAKAGRKQGFS